MNCIFNLTQYYKHKELPELEPRHSSLSKLQSSAYTDWATEISEIERDHLYRYVNSRPITNQIQINLKLTF